MSNQDLKFLYSTAQVATTLGIGRSTVNNYVRGLEESGYTFLKDNNNNRTYTEHDIVTLRALCELRDRGVDRESAIKSIVERYGRLSRSESVDLVAPSNSVHDLATVNAKMDELIAAVGQMTLRINEIIDERVRNEVAAAAAGLSDQVNEVLKEVQVSQEKTDQKLDEIGSRLEAHGKRKKWFGLF